MSYFKLGGYTELLVIGLIAASLGYFLYLLKAGKKMPTMRAFPALSAVEDGVDRALEMGRPFMYMFGTMADLTGEFAAAVAACYEMMRFLAEKCYIKGVRFIAVPGLSPTVVPYIDAILREAALKVGKPEAYVMDRDLKYLGRSYTTSLCSLIETEKPGTAATIGVIGGPDMAAWEVVLRNDALFIGGTHRLVQCGVVAVAADYAFICDEVYAACAAASGSRELSTTVLSGDFPKWALIGVVLIGIVLGLVGIKIAPLLNN